MNDIYCTTFLSAHNFGYFTFCCHCFYIAMIAAVVVIKHRLQWNSTHCKQVHTKTKSLHKCSMCGEYRPIDILCWNWMINNAWWSYSHTSTTLLIFQFEMWRAIESKEKQKKTKKKKRSRLWSTLNGMLQILGHWIVIISFAFYGGEMEIETAIANKHIPLPINGINVEHEKKWKSVVVYAQVWSVFKTQFNVLGL